MSLKSINPFTNQLIKEYHEHTHAQLVEILDLSAKAFHDWKMQTYANRAMLFGNLAGSLLADKRMFAELITSEMGKPVREAEAEIQKCVDGIRYYMIESERLLKNEPISSDTSESYLSFEPLGTVLAFMPWNFPFWQTFRCAAPAMMAGNTVLLKLAPNTSGCALAIEKLFVNAGFPKGSFQSILAGHETTPFLIGHPAVQAVSLTGSSQAGMIVAAEAGKNLKKAVLELGGSDPFIVLPDADMDKTLEVAVKSRLQNTGQSCIAAKRFILVKPVAEKFLQGLKVRLTGLKTGDPMDVSTDLGPMARMDLKESLKKQVKVSLEKGAELFYGKLNENPDAFFEPLILKNVRTGMPAWDEELFGPVFSIIEVESEEEAIRVANDSIYGLGASIWTKDISKAKILASGVESGMVFINDLVRSDVRLPFGGVKQSGYGRELAEAGIKEFVNVKTVYLK